MTAPESRDMVYRWTGDSHGRGASSAVFAEASEQTLVKGLRQGDNEAYTALYDLYHPRILSFVTRILGNPDDAHDVTQEVFLKAFRRLPSGDRALALKPWLYKVASTTCLDHLRARRRRTEAIDISCEDVPDTGDAFEQAEISGLMQEAIDGISGRHRLVLVLKDVHGLRHDEIAEILGVSRGATETLLFRARAAFRREYSRLRDGDGEARRDRAKTACPEKRQTALAIIRRDTSPEERKRVLDHARTCRDCRGVIRRSRATESGLAALLPGAWLLGWLRPADLVARLTSPAAADAGSGSGGVIVTLAQALGTKAAVVAAAATVTVSLPGNVVVQRDTGRTAADRATASTGETSRGMATASFASEAAADAARSQPGEDGGDSQMGGGVATADGMPTVSDSVPGEAATDVAGVGSEATDAGIAVAAPEGSGDGETTTDGGPADADEESGETGGASTSGAGQAAVADDHPPDLSPETAGTAQTPPTDATDSETGAGGPAPADSAV